MSAVALLAFSRHNVWLVTAGLYFIVDVILAFTFEPVMLVMIAFGFDP